MNVSNARWRLTACVLLGGLGLGGVACTDQPGEAEPTTNASEAGAGVERSKPNVLLISLDTLRADRLSSYGYRLPTTPAIDALAQRGVLFEDVTVPTPKTWPSVATMLTGANPRTTGVRLASRQMRDGLPTLAEVFSAAGYRTAGVVTNYNLLPEYGFGKGFGTYIEAWEDAWQLMQPGAALSRDPKQRLMQLFGAEDMRSLIQATDAKLVTDRGLAWLDESPAEQPFFLWLHYMDPHGPYDPAPGYGKLFDGQYPVQELTPEALKSPHVHRLKGQTDPVSDLGFYEARYDREIRSTDDQLGRLFAQLAQRGLAADTLIVVTADHGEALGDHDYYFEHGDQPYQECARVPLVMAHGQQLAAGLRVSEPVGLIDVPSTVLELVGLELPSTFEGQSLAGLARGEAGARAPAHVFMESGSDKDPNRLMQLSVRQGPWKLILVRSAEDQASLGQGPIELYDLSVDPDEQVNLATDPSPQVKKVVQKLLHELRVWKAKYPAGVGKSSAEFESELDPEMRNALIALGYISGGVEEDLTGAVPATDTQDRCPHTSCVDGRCSEQSCRGADCISEVCADKAGAGGPESGGL